MEYQKLMLEKQDRVCLVKINHPEALNALNTVILQELDRAFDEIAADPETALSNAIEHFEINEKEADIILNHMWPLTITKMPSCKESFLVSAMDKYCSLKENFNRVKKVKWIPQFAK